MKFLIAAALLLSASGASLLEQRIEEVLRTARALGPGVVGIEAIQLRSGKVLYSRNSDKLFTPASNTKLFSTALALSRLGPNYRLKTQVLVTAGPDTEGRVTGDLILVGGGDPSMSDLVIPYDVKAKPADPMAAIDNLADQIVAKGVREILGDVVGDDSAWPWEPIPPGWAANDSIWEYGAPVSALTFNHGRFRLLISPGAEPGDAPELALAPAIEYFAISNRLRTAADGETRIDVDRDPGARQIRLSGTVSKKAKLAEELLAVDDPALYTATALADALMRRGVVVRGGPVARHRDSGEPRPSPGRVIAERESPPLIELLRVVDKVSQNLWAEMMLRAVAHARTGDGSRKNALEELKRFLLEAGLSADGFAFQDGSGLSRLGLVSPGSITKLLRYMYLSDHGVLWKSLMPVGALDGTLERRFSKNTAANAISAKTGSLSHVNALSGYAESATYGEVGFSILVNHTLAPASEVRAAIDRIALALLD